MVVSEHKQHNPVLLGSAIEGLNVRQDGIYIDGTFGRGGHARALLQELGENGRLLVIDRDPEAIEVAQEMLAGDMRCHIEHATFAEVEQICARLGWLGKVDGVLLDLGVSSPQLDSAERGFSFMHEGPLDMRMDPSAGESAAQWLAHAQEREIAKVLKEFGEEKQARKIARAIVRYRERAAIETTLDLANLVESVIPRRGNPKHPATRTFQAIRIYVNDELGMLKRFLESVLGLLAPNGRLAVISFHSLEDRIVKRFMRDNSKTAELPPGIPFAAEEIKPKLRLVGKAARPDEQELGINVRSRSATLRVAEMLG